MLPFSRRFRAWLLQPVLFRLDILQALLERLTQMATSQQQFDTDLQNYLGAVKAGVTTLLQEVEDLKKAAAAGADLTAEDQAVQQAAQDLQNALAAPVPSPAGTPPAAGGGTTGGGAAGTATSP